MGMNKKFFCVNCGQHSYKADYPDKCPECKEADGLVEVKDQLMTITPTDRYILQHTKAIIKKDDKRKQFKGVTPKMWNGGIYDYYTNPSLPWKCEKCDARFKYKNQVKDHKLEAHAY